MIIYAVGLFAGIMILAGTVAGVVAFIAMLRRAPRTRFHGVISVSCLLIGGLTAWAIERTPPSMYALYVFSLYAMPGMLAIIIAPKSRPQPGHCTTCGYNLTGNVSGKCSECGTAMVNSEERIAT